MNLELRLAVLDDVPTLARAEREIAQTPGFLASRPNEIVDARFPARITDPLGRFLVAEVDGAIVGHGVLEPLSLAVTRHVVQLTLAVHLGWQGKGIGRALLTALLEWARAAPHVERVELRVRSGNTAAIALYEQLGFVEEGRLKNRIKLGPGQYVDDVCMGLEVAARHASN